MPHVDAGNTPELGPVSVNPSLKNFGIFFCGAPKRINNLVRSLLPALPLPSAQHSHIRLNQPLKNA